MFPRWLSWLFVGVMLYMIYVSSQLHRTGSPSGVVGVVPEITEKNYPALAKVADMERWKNALNPDYAARHQCAVDTATEANGLALKVMEDTAGTGAGAQCGETITLMLTVWGSRGSKAFEGEVPVALGAREVAAGLDVGLLGMKINAVRTLVLPPAMLLRDKAGNLHDAARKALPVDRLAVVTVRRVK